MAIDIEAARLLLASAKAGVPFTRSVMLGRQSYLPGNTESRRLLEDFGVDPRQHAALFAGDYPNRYAEAFFAVLGARHLDSMDASAFEGATIIHDLNRPVPLELVGQYDAVYDGGTLEHVFNFLIAIENCMNLVKVGGRVFLHTTANNYFGHGFFQFSADLFYRIFAPANGFVVERMVAMEYGPRRRWYEVADPEVIRQRTPLINPFPVLLFVQARKAAEVPLFRTCPQQSDYSIMWAESVGKNGQGSASPAGPGLGVRLKTLLIERAPGLARFLEAFKFSQLNCAFSFRNRAAFRPVNKRSLRLS